MACYDFDYAIQMLHQAIDFAEIEHDFVPLRKWVNEVERSGKELEAIENRLGLPTGQGVLLAILQSVSEGATLPVDAAEQIGLWMMNGQMPVPKVETVPQLQFA